MDVLVHIRNEAAFEFFAPQRGRCGQWRQLKTNFICGRCPGVAVGWCLEAAAFAARVLFRSLIGLAYPRRVRAA